jgi:hypothetical protein
VQGFRRPLMREKLIDHFNVIKCQLSDVLHAAVKHHIRGPSSVYAISFPEASMAAKAYETLRQIELEWVDPINNYSRTIKVYRDQKPEDRSATRIVSQMWEPLLDLLKAKGKWVEGMRLLNYQRQMWIVDGNEPYPLFRIHFPTKDDVVILVENKTKDHYEITDAEADTLKNKGMATRSRTSM